MYVSDACNILHKLSCTIARLQNDLTIFDYILLKHIGNLMQVAS